ncbi:hypothetical protein Clacol_009197 [Clathrus columnatus]|uniref:Uncharacterized protein n=1 Tax=Clathrus columnatus TaxID=1419009 RepID=A0AAV5AJU9_9AGAM|nr:hypothetical protein Clacol_009197 [Clathrus columnatus]
MSYPWQLDANSLPSDNVQHPRVILVLGEPSQEALTPLLQSTHLSSSLLVIAAARKYRPPSNFTSTVAILRLSSPLISSESHTSTRLVNTLQRAHKIAQHWRSSSSPFPQFKEYEEEVPSVGYLSPTKSNNRLSWFGGGNGTATTNSSMTELGLATPPPTRSASRLSLSKRSPDSSTSISSLASPPIPAVNEANYAFDTIFNFLPALDSPDATLLKFAILVTTISRPFITCTLPSFSHSTLPKPSRRFSIRPAELDSTPSQQLSMIQPSPAHIVHLVPSARSSLIAPLETFCLSFAYPSHSLPTFSAPSRIDMGKPGPPPRPFILPPIVLGEVLPISRKWTITELILCGALDGPSWKSKSATNRAWLSSSNDIHVIGGSRAFQKSPARSNVLPNFSAPGYEPHRSSSLRNHAYSSHDEEDEKDDGTCHTSQWPTPPSSNSSSPTPSVAASAVSADPATKTTIRPLGPSNAGLLTPPESDTSDSSDTVKKRRGILKWIRRR